jgi:uncharacterized membrane protein
MAVIVASSNGTVATRPKRRLSPPWRKAVVLVHVVSSVGWLGVSAGFVVLTLALLGTRDAATLRGGYALHELMVSWLARPAALITLFTGLVLSFGTPWSLFRCWWVPTKLVLVVATIVVTIANSPTLLRYTVQHADATGSPEYLSAQRWLVAMAVYHVVMISAAAVLSVFKPGGRLARRRVR